MRSTCRAAAVLILAALVPAAASAGSHRIGFGYHYWKTIGTIDSPSQVDDNGYGSVFSYQYLPGGLVRFEADLEYYKDGFGGSNSSAYSPEAYLLVGRIVYAGVGVGVTKSDNLPNDKSWSDPWYAGRVGVELLLVPRIHLDINANYRADAFQGLRDAKADAMTLGASVRVSF